MIRHFFAIGPALVCANLVLGALFPVQMYRLTHPPVQRIPGTHQPAQPSTRAKAISLTPLCWGEAGAIFFLVDSLRRKYRGARAVAVAFALLGPVSIGMTSLFYYAFWGCHPLEPQAAVFGEKFCPRCLSLTADKAAPGSVAWNLVFGTRYMGSSDRCEDCKSVVRTLWAWAILPIFPLGSYRVIPLETYRFIGRRTALRWPQVAAVYVMGLAVVAIGVAIYLYNH